MFVLRFSNSDKKRRIKSIVKKAVKISSVVKQLLYVLNLFCVIAGSIHSFQIRSKETPRIMYPKYPVWDMIQRIHLCCGSFGLFGSIIRF